jgi:hypothetical protein
MYLKIRNILNRTMFIIAWLYLLLIGLCTKNSYANDFNHDDYTTINHLEKYEVPEYYNFLEPDGHYYDWNVMFYYGRINNNILLKVLRGDIEILQGNRRADVYSLELDRQLRPYNEFRKFFQPFLSTIDLAFNITYQNDPIGNIFEFNPYIRFVWQDFPWKNYLITILAVGEGISYATEIEQFDRMTPEQHQKARRLLNYLMFEIGFALPQYPRLEVYYRIHHRSGIFGTYAKLGVGSTAVGGAIRYKF